MKLGVSFSGMVLERLREREMIKSISGRTTQIAILPLSAFRGPNPSVSFAIFRYWT